MQLAFFLYPSCPKPLSEAPPPVPLPPGGFQAGATPEEGAGVVEVSLRAEPREGWGSLGEPKRLGW